MTTAAAAAQSHPATAAARIHPAAWAVALALHLAAFAVLLPRPRDLPAGPAFTVGLSDLRGAPEADAPAEPADAAPGEAAASPAEPAPPEPPAPVVSDAPPVPAAPSPSAAPPPTTKLPPPPPAPPVPREGAVAGPARSPVQRTAPPARASAAPPPSPQATSPQTTSPPATSGPAAPASLPAGPSAGGEADFAQLPPDYAAAIARILRRGLRYPPPARDQGIEGTAMVRFAIARDGTILGAQLVRGSGSVLLDHEALALLRRVSPLPRLPETVPGASAAVLVPIGFALN